jgi:hypothetical protein
MLTALISRERVDPYRIGIPGEHEARLRLRVPRQQKQRKCDFNDPDRFSGWE